MYLNFKNIVLVSLLGVCCTLFAAGEISVQGVLETPLGQLLRTVITLSVLNYITLKAGEPLSGKRHRALLRSSTVSSA